MCFGGGWSSRGLGYLRGGSAVSLGLVGVGTVERLMNFLVSREVVMMMQSSCSCGKASPAGMKV
jgi:hypothetical protein